MAAVVAVVATAVAVQVVLVAAVQVAQVQAMELLVLQTQAAAVVDLLLARCQRMEQMVVAVLLSFAI